MTYVDLIVVVSLLAMAICCGAIVYLIFFYEDEQLSQPKRQEKKRMVETFKIEKSVEIPPANRGRGSRGAGKLRATMEELEVGDSFVIPRKKTAYSWSLAKKIGIKTTTRKVGIDKTRVWRVE